MKITPVSGPGASIGAVTSGEPQQSMVEKIRSLKMNTNATPGRMEGLPPPPIEEKLANSDVISDTPEPVNEDTQPLSPQLAALARAKRALQLERQQFDKEKAEHTASKQDVDSVPLAKLKSNAMRTLQELGIPYDQLIQEITSDQNGYNPEIQELKNKIATLETGIDKKLTDRELQQKQAALAEMGREATSIVSSSPEFQAIKDEDAVPQVIQYIEEKYDSTGEILDVRKACERVNQWLIEDAKRRSKWLQAEALAPALLASQPQQPQRQMKTLTNRDTASVPLSRRARAIAAAHGNLKQ